MINTRVNGTFGSIWKRGEFLEASYLNNSCSARSGYTTSPDAAIVSVIPYPKGSVLDDGSVSSRWSSYSATERRVKNY